MKRLLLAAAELVTLAIILALDAFPNTPLWPSPPPTPTPEPSALRCPPDVIPSSCAPSPSPKPSPR